jgi:endonuclease-3
LVQELRKDKTAPCDTAGAEALVLPPIDGEQNDELYAKTRRFQTLVALMLSSQTKDAMVERAMENLRATDGDGGGDGLTIASIMVMDPEVLNSKINMVGFHNNKTKYLKQVAEILHEKYDDDIPLTADEMIRNLPGIGPKMAYIIEPICWGVLDGIAVQTTTAANTVFCHHTMMLSSYDDARFPSSSLSDNIRRRSSVLKS